MPSMPPYKRERRSVTLIDISLPSAEKSRPSLSRRTSANNTRAPFAPLDLQSTTAFISADHMTSSSSISAASDGKGTPEKSRYNIGRPIMVEQFARDGDDIATPLHVPRRTNVNSNTSSRTSSTARRTAHAHTPSSSSLSSRRTSLPAIHLRAPLPSSNDFSAAGSQVSPFHVIDNPPTPSPAYLTNDDLYSGLSTFTFGAAHAAAPPADTDMISPLTVVRRGSADRTPRPSIFDSGLLRRNEEADSETDQEEAVRRRRSKMRAVDDGTRRPSLPTNIYSERESGAMSSDTETDDFDTDVELESSSVSEQVMSDTASQHTFGGIRSGHGGALDSTLHLNAEDGESGSESESPVIFSRDFAGDYDGLYGGRRGSLPMDIPIVNLSISGSVWDPAQSRDREGSIATLRRPSRSLDVETHPINLSAGPTAVVGTSSSEPQTRGDWVSLENQMQEQHPENIDTYDGLNLDYILSGTRRLSGQSDVLPSTPGIRFNQHESGWWPLVTGAQIGARRPSTATMGTIDDTFMKHVNVHNPEFAMDWTFNKEKADGDISGSIKSGPSEATSVRHEGMKVGTQEIWRCPYVGRFKVDRAAAITDPAKPQHRLNVKHIVDPYSKGNTRGGPSVIIHKHSRAIAFSIFRHHHLFGSRHGGATSMSMNSSILLAPKKVQEQYTSTRTTSHLNTHGLLEDRPGRSGVKDPGSSQPHSRSRSHRENSKREKDKEKKKEKTKGKGKVKEKEEEKKVAETRLSATERAMDVTSPPEQRNHSNYQSSSSFSPGSPASSSGMQTTDPQTSSKSSSLDFTSYAGSTMATSSYSHSSSGDPDNMDLDDDEQPPPRTSHAEAFAALDPNSIESVRAKAERRVAEHHISTQPSITERFFNRFVAPHSSKGTHKTSVHTAPHTATFDAKYNPPWLTMAPRSQQEEQERVLLNLNASFKDVGLLPSFKSNKTRSKPRNRPNSSSSVFEDIPPDSLYMLLPLWAGQTDSGSSLGTEEESSYSLSLENRQYLLVYYVPLDKKNGRKDKDSSKKRARAQTTHEMSAPQVDKHILLGSFRVCSRLLGYEDLRGTGVRLPSDGLVVTGSMSEAMRNIPPPSIRAECQETVIIGVCQGRENGMFFGPDGLEKLGLCVPAARGGDSVYDMTLDPQLTAVGRAVVEMAWLGCMALTSFANV